MPRAKLAKLPRLVDLWFRKQALAQRSPAIQLLIRQFPFCDGKRQSMLVSCFSSCFCEHSQLPQPLTQQRLGFPHSERDAARTAGSSFSLRKAAGASCSVLLPGCFPQGKQWASCLLRTLGWNTSREAQEKVRFGSHILWHKQTKLL